MVARGRRMTRNGERGLTLLELIIVIGILVLLLGIGASGLSNLSSTQLRTQTNRMAAALRHTYSRTVATGLYMRMVLDFEADAYEVQASAIPVFIYLEEDAKWRAALEGQREKDIEDGVAIVDTRADFKPDNVIPKVTMEKGIQIDSVLIAGDTDPVSGGQASIHFFPNGFVEPAMIYVSDGDGEFRTLILNPLTGKVTHRPGKVDPARDFGEPDKVEEEGR